MGSIHGEISAKPPGRCRATSVPFHRRIGGEWDCWRARERIVWTRPRQRLAPTLSPVRTRLRAGMAEW